jgi:hypothetical protein
LSEDGPEAHTGKTTKAEKRLLGSVTLVQCDTVLVPTTGSQTWTI